MEDQTAVGWKCYVCNRPIAPGELLFWPPQQESPTCKECGQKHPYFNIREKLRAAEQRLAKSLSELGRHVR